MATTIEDEILELSRQVKETNDLAREKLQSVASGNTITVVHKTSGSNILAVVCAAIAGLCLIASMLVARQVDQELMRQDHDLHDLRAWRDIQQNHISAIEAREQQRGTAK